MPNLLAHRLFIDNIIQCNSLEEKEIIALRLGTQGPDPMFYHGIIPWRSWHFIIALKKIGNKLHKENGSLDCISPDNPVGAVKPVSPFNDNSSSVNHFEVS